MQNLENRLWVTAVQQARMVGMEYSVPCSRNVHDLIAAGINNMRRQGRVSETDLETADSNLSRLISSMISTTRDLGTGAISGEKTKIREGALVQAKELCPLWPFG
ncbi:MAG TPA: hypothetical protein DCQ83_03880 [Fibrobacteres bacterium]|jgi:hypothetical protein|nr:hypothetical protein [Fibrobacterota bacterium]